MFRLRLAASIALVVVPIFASDSLGQAAHFGAMRHDRGTESRPFDLQKTWLDLKLDEQAKTFEGIVTHELQLLEEEPREIWFDAAGLQVTSVMVNGELARYRQELEEERLHVTLPGTMARGDSCGVAIEYYGESPERGLYYIQPDADDPTLGYEIWSQGQSENNRHWIPTWDYPTDRGKFEAMFTVRDGLTVVSNGALVETFSQEDGWKTWHFRLDFDFPAYLISLCVGDYECYVDDWRGIPVEYYVQKGVGEERARRSFGQTPDMLDFFSKITGIDYPYPKYAQVAVQRFIVGGMENISATTQSDRTLHDEREHLDRSSQGLVAHELAHQWFGDFVTCRTWRHLWLNEGFANYYEALYDRTVRGEEAFQLNMYRNQRSATGRDRPGQTRPLVETFFSRAEKGGGSNHVYTKGSSVLYMLNHLLGDEQYHKAIHHFLVQHAGQLVSSHDLEVAIEEATGRNLHWLFEQFVYLPGHPHYEVSYEYQPSKAEVVLQVKQTQNTDEMVPLFRYPVPIEITCKEGAQMHTVWVDQKEQEIRLPAASEPLMVRFDKGSRLLKTMDFTKSDREWSYQALYDSDAVGRLQAVAALGEAQDRVLARQALESVLASGDQAEIRARAASSTAKLGGPEAVASLLAGLSDRESRVRRECADRLGDLKDQLGDWQDPVVGRLTESLRNDLSYQVQMNAAKSLGRIGHEKAIPALQEASWVDSPRHQVARAAQSARIKLKDESCAGEILELLIQPMDHRARRLGVTLTGSLGETMLGERRGDAVSELLKLAEHSAAETQRSAVRSLGQLHAAEAEPLLQRLKEESDSRFLTWYIESSLKRIAEHGKKVQDGESGELDQLRKSLQEMMQRVDRMNRRIEELEKTEALDAVGAGS